ncbi:hypothetical protein OEZ71_16160 [Defluviimonas sp. WL0050]|uniref:Lipopolysaccharide export system protein LptC n=1 Tax=Albidovulum litorale TaxID=2984134 RepID=A0ABT2ZRP8_9RHOB|nr:hypothetical protein [Defluviimonas sp. WL0050]MCV2873834.1 hypothetical protein [Defluviimonas sp. WL0050]
MATRDNVYSSVIFWLKIALPLIALVILSTLFLFSRRIDTEASLPYAEVDIDTLARDQRLTAPEYSAVTTDGAALSVSADIARPSQGEGSASAEQLVAAYETRDGLRIDLTAAAGELDRAAGRLLLSGGVVIVTSEGYRMITAGLDGALDRTELVSDGEVEADAPFGRIEAGGMEISHSDAGMPGYDLVFNKGVKLIYEPVN